MSSNKSNVPFVSDEEFQKIATDAIRKNRWRRRFHRFVSGVQDELIWLKDDWTEVKRYYRHIRLVRR